MNKFSDGDLTGALWMLENQMHEANDLVKLWNHFPRKHGPTVERVKGKWWEGLFV